MAKLSTRVDENTLIRVDVENHEVREVKYDPEDVDLYIGGQLVKDFRNFKITNTKQENTNMNNTFRTLNITLIDLSQELKGEKKVVFEKQNVRTEYSDEQTKMNLVAKGKVLKALEDHNENVRAKTLDHAYKGSAREVFLEPIDHLGDSRLQWEIVRVG